MKYIRLSILSLFICISAVLGAQTSKALLVLDNYTIPMDVKGEKVGQFVTPKEGAVSLVKDESGLFEIAKTGELVLKKNKVVTATSPMSFVITVEHAGEQKTFEIVKDEFIKNRVIAHRGAWKHTGVSQNSLGALQQAINLGCEGSELDVWLTKDKKVALNHDYDLEGKIIEKSTLADIQTVKLKNDELVPTLEEYINLVKTQNKTRLVLELKSNKGNANIIELTDSCVQIVHRMNAQAWVDYISFDYRGMKVVREMDATAHIAFLEPSVDLDLQKLDGMSGIDYYHGEFDKIEKLYERCQVLGLTTNAWTVNSEEKMKHLLDMGLDFITTDEPELLLKLVENRK